MRRRGAVSGERLTARERAVLEAMAAGLSSAEVAERLSISLEDARDGLKRAMAGLGARSKLEAIVIAIREGVIDPPTAQAP
jgi:DNA-binding CsgD family transcriptional regulator